VEFEKLPEGLTQFRFHELSHAAVIRMMAAGQPSPIIAMVVEWRDLLLRIWPNATVWMTLAIIQNELGPTGPPFPFERLSPERLIQLANLQRADSVEDLNYWRPSIVLVERGTSQHSCQGIEGKNFDMISWFSQSPAFAAAWSPYRRQPGIEKLRRLSAHPITPR
jgi:hypothetical protein